MRLATVVTAVSLAACAHAPPEGRWWPEQDTCFAVAGRACHRAGWAALAGAGGVPDDHAAAYFFMLGCEGGGAESCADLAALYAAGRGVRKDDGRACDLGLAEACERTGRPPPSRVRTPTASLPPPAEAPARPGPEASDLDHALAYARYFVDEPAHETLGMTKVALEADPPAPRSELEGVRALKALRRAKAERCLPIVRYAAREGSDRDESGAGAGAGAGERQPPQSGEDHPGRPIATTAWATFILEPDGRTGGVRVVADLAHREDEEASPSAREERLAAERCVAEVITSWEFPRPTRSGRVWVKFVGNGPERVRIVERTDASPGPREMPRMRAPDCFGRTIRIPRSQAGARRLVEAKFVIGRDGRVGRFQILTEDLPLALAEAIATSVQGCEWLPATDGGKPTAMWVVLPVRLEAGYR